MFHYPKILLNFFYCFLNYHFSNYIILYILYFIGVYATILCFIICLIITFHISSQFTPYLTFIPKYSSTLFAYPYLRSNKSQKAPCLITKQFHFFIPIYSLSFFPKNSFTLPKKLIFLTQISLLLFPIYSLKKGLKRLIYKLFKVLIK